MKRFLMTASLVLLTNGAVAADTEQASRASVESMFEVMGMERQMSSSFDAMMPMVQNLAQRLRLDQAGLEELQQIFRSWYEEDLDHDRVEEEMIALYQESFTDAEIEKITEFYSSPVGEKFLEVSPKLMQRGSAIGMREADANKEKLQKRMQPFLEKHAPGRMSLGQPAQQ